MRNILILATAVFFFVACDKTNNLSPDACEELKGGLITNNKTLIKKSLEAIIAKLPSAIYSEDNLAALVASIESNCSITASFDCFNCIKTLPPMTEIYLTVGNGATKTVDLSYDDSNMIVFKNLH